MNIGHEHTGLSTSTKKASEPGIAQDAEKSRVAVTQDGADRGEQRKPFWQKAFPWVVKGTLAIMDQGLIAGSNFVIGILLARWLVPAEYGAYAVAFAVFLLLAMLYQSLMLEPVGVFGVSAYGDRVRGYIKTLVCLHGLTALPMVASLCIAAGIAWRFGQADGLAGGLLGLALSTPAVLLLWLARRVFYLQRSAAPAVGGASLYCALSLGALAVAYKLHVLSPMTAFLMMGLGALGGGAFLLLYLKVRLPRGQAAPTMRDSWQRHWRYGKWALGSAAMMWVPANIFYPLVSSFRGMTEAGELKALMNFATPMLQLYAALSLLLLPYATRVYSQSAHRGARRAALRITTLCIAGAIAYWGVLLLFHAAIFRVLYSGRYTEVEFLMPVVALASISGTAFFGPATILRAMETPKHVFAAVSVASCLSVVVGVPATKFLGVQGAVWGIAISESIAFIIALLMLRAKLREVPSYVPLLALSVADSAD
jgi:O-antigen/teichoic acid export membrane protein